MEIHEGTTKPLVEELLRRELDCVVGRYSPEYEAELDQQLLSHQKFAVVVSRSHNILRKKKPITLADTIDLDWIVTPPRTAARQALIDMFMRAGLRAPDIRVETASMEIMKAALADCNMIGLRPGGIAAPHVETRQLEILQLKADYPPAPLMLIRRRTEPALPSVERFCRTLTEIAPSLEMGTPSSDICVGSRRPR